MHILQRAALIDAAEAIGVEGLHPHELRHTAPSLAIAAGANIKVVQTMLSHKSDDARSAYDYTLRNSGGVDG
jgi:integrase